MQEAFRSALSVHAEDRKAAQSFFDALLENPEWPVQLSHVICNSNHDPVMRMQAGVLLKNETDSPRWAATPPDVRITTRTALLHWIAAHPDDQPSIVDLCCVTIGRIAYKDLKEWPSLPDDIRESRSIQAALACVTALSRNRAPRGRVAFASFASAMWSFAVDVQQSTDPVAPNFMYATKALAKVVTSLGPKWASSAPPVVDFLQASPSHVMALWNTCVARSNTCTERSLRAYNKMFLSFLNNLSLLQDSSILDETGIRTNILTVYRDIAMHVASVSVDEKTAVQCLNVFRKVALSAQSPPLDAEETVSLVTYLVMHLIRIPDIDDFESVFEDDDSDLADLSTRACARVFVSDIISKVPSVTNYISQWLSNLDAYDQMTQEAILFVAGSHYESFDLESLFVKLNSILPSAHDFLKCRIVWLAARCFDDGDPNMALKASLLQLLAHALVQRQPESDAVQRAALRAFSKLDIYQTEQDIPLFAPFLDSSIHEALHLLSVVDDDQNARAYILSALCTFVCLVGPNLIRPHLDSIVNAGHTLWTQSQPSDSYLRTAVATGFQHILNIVGSSLPPQSLDTFLLLAQSCVDPVDPTHLYLECDGLDMWAHVLNTYKSAQDMSPFALHMITPLAAVTEQTVDASAHALRCVRAYTLLAPEHLWASPMVSVLLHASEMCLQDTNEATRLLFTLSLLLESTRQKCDAQHVLALVPATAVASFMQTAASTDAKILIRSFFFVTLSRLTLLGLDILQYMQEWPPHTQSVFFARWVDAVDSVSDIVDSRAIAYGLVLTTIAALSRGLPCDPSMCVSVMCSAMAQNFESDIPSAAMQRATEFMDDADDIPESPGVLRRQECLTHDLAVTSPAVFFKAALQGQSALFSTVDDVLLSELERRMQS